MIYAILANVDAVTQLESVTKSAKMMVSDTIVAFIAGGVICGVFVAWAIYRRTRRKRVTGGEKVYRSIHTSGEDEAVADAEEVRRRYKRRVRRRDHRGRNPTLAETGGLPPVRTEPEGGPS